MMHREIPSLTALRAFEAAARLQSVNKAATELNVTHAAVSQQIRALEEAVGVQLLTRAGRGLDLTEAGRRYAAELTEAFRHLLEASRQVRRISDTARVRVTLTPNFASRWMLPRLRRFKALHPDVTVSLRPESDIVDLVAEGVDIGIRFGDGDWPKLTSERIVGGTLAPVCSPDYLASAPPIRCAEDLFSHPLLEDHDSDEWAAWFRAAGVADPVIDTADYSMIGNLALQAAVEGHGIYLGVLSMLEDDLQANRLVLPLGRGADSDSGYFLVRPAGMPLRPPAQQVWDWVLAESCGIPEA